MVPDNINKGVKRVCSQYQMKLRAQVMSGTREWSLIISIKERNEYAANTREKLRAQVMFGYQNKGEGMFSDIVYLLGFL